MGAVTTPAAPRFLDVGPAPELERGHGLQVRVDGVAVAVFRGPDGLRALDDRCPHAGAPLHTGRCDDEGVVICPWHAFRFDATTGRCLIGEGRAGVRTRAVQVRDGRLFVEA